MSASDAGGAGFTPVSDAADLAMVATAVEESRRVGLDTETTGLDPRTDRLRLLQLATERGTYLVDCFAVGPSPLWGALSGVELVGHNLAFDLAFLARLRFEPGRVFDTQRAAELLTGRQGRGYFTLAQTVERELGRDLDKAGQKSDWSVPVLTADQFRYAAADAEVLPPLADALAARHREASLERVAAIEARAVPAVAWMAGAGVGFDRAAWGKLAAEAEAERDRLRGLLDDEAPTPDGRLFKAINWNSTDQVQEVFRKAGVVLDSTGDDALAACDHPLAALLRDYRTAAKLVSTYGRDWLKHVASDGRAYPGWQQIGAGASGRMSCRDPNVQNLPRDPRYRRCFVAPPGRVLVKADYSQIELRIAAKVSGDARMLEAYRTGEDLHALTARSVLGKADVTKADRQTAKSLNFGLLYGMGAKGLRAYARSNYGVELTEAQAREYRAAFFRAYPGLRRWHNSVPDRPIETRTLAGRRRQNVAKFTEKLNTPVQGTGADGLKTALALLWERRADCPGAVPVLAVHDEIVVEVDASQAEAVSGWLRQAMLDGMVPLVEPVPVEVEIGVAPTWGG